MTEFNTKLVSVGDDAKLATLNAREVERKITRAHTPRGSRVTCSDCGLPICEVVVDDAYAGTYGNRWGNVFGNWRVEPPRTGQLLSGIQCPACGGQWIRERRMGAGFVHFAGYGWWPGELVTPKNPSHPFVVKRGWWTRLVERMGVKLNKATFSVMAEADGDPSKFGAYVTVTAAAPFDVDMIGIKFNTVVPIDVAVATGDKDVEMWFMSTTETEPKTPCVITRGHRVALKMKSFYPNLTIPIYVTLYRKKHG